MKGKFALLLAAAAAVAFAGGHRIRDDSAFEGVIHACYGQDGSLRVVDDSMKPACRPHEKVGDVVGRGAHRDLADRLASKCLDTE
jgi:hypothetical protein